MSHPTRIRIFDTTLRDGEQSPGATLNFSEKLEIARHLEAQHAPETSVHLAGGKCVTRVVAQSRIEDRLDLGSVLQPLGKEHGRTTLFVDPEIDRLYSPRTEERVEWREDRTRGVLDEVKAIA